MPLGALADNKLLYLKGLTTSLLQNVNLMKIKGCQIRKTRGIEIHPCFFSEIEKQFSFKSLKPISWDEIMFLVEMCYVGESHPLSHPFRSLTAAGHTDTDPKCGRHPKSTCTEPGRTRVRCCQQEPTPASSTPPPGDACHPPNSGTLFFTPALKNHTQF